MNIFRLDSQLSCTKSKNSRLFFKDRLGSALAKVAIHRPDGNPYIYRSNPSLSLTGSFMAGEKLLPFYGPHGGLYKHFFYKPVKSFI